MLLSDKIKTYYCKTGENVTFIDNGIWKKAKIVKKITEPYIIVTEGDKMLWRNTSQMRKSVSKFNNYSKGADDCDI